MELALTSAIELTERGLAPDVVIRVGIRRLLAQRLASERRGGVEAQHERLRALIAELRESPVALETERANQQHYEVPAAFFREVLGPHLKYSSAWWGPDQRDLAGAEAAMLRITAERAEIADGMQVLDLGCGWGSLSLWLAERFPNARIVGISNSSSQRRFILETATTRGLTNLEVETQDVNRLALDRSFDRVVSVEMLEHVRNYDQLFARIAGALVPGGKLFAHVFCHRQLAYPFEADGADNWMGRHFFSGGLMPSADLFLHFQTHAVLEDQWLIGGVHYARTARAWLERLDARRDAVRRVFEACYGPGEAERWIQRWRVFFMACEELWGYREGQEWGVCHYRFVRR